MTARGSSSIVTASAFIDSSAFFALVSSRDANNPTAKAIAQRLEAKHWRLFTTNFVRAEAHALILNRASHQAADRFLSNLRQSGPTTIIRVSEEDEEQALALIERYKDKDFSLTDAISFVVMEKLGVRHAFVFDRNLVQYGLSALTPEMI
jgi:predicted nucleic acid-binding protein